MTDVKLKELLSRDNERTWRIHDQLKQKYFELQSKHLES